MMLRMRCLLALLPWVVGCSQQPQPAAPAAPVVVVGYDLGQPLRSFELPQELREVSGLAAVDARTVACVQDEKGTLFFVDVIDGRVTRTARFGPKGDYEALARTGDGFCVLRSDGAVLRLAPKDDRYEIVQTGAASFGAKEYEGLALDRDGKRLLVAPKSVDKEDKDTRVLHALDLATLAPAREPALAFACADVLALALRQGIASAQRITEKGKQKLAWHLRLSEVTVHPATGDCWILSGPDRLLLVVAADGKVLGMRQFAAEELPQPEGAAFLPGGELVLASEAKGGRAIVRVYGKAR